MSIRSELRQQLAAHTLRCEWPQCGQRWTELAHLHSIGTGGRASADTIDNVALMCPNHARLSDGIWLTRQWAVQELAKIGHKPGDKAWSVAESLRDQIYLRRSETRDRETLR